MMETMVNLLMILYIKNKKKKKIKSPWNRDEVLIFEAVEEASSQNL